MPVPDVTEEAGTEARVGCGDQFQQGHFPVTQTSAEAH